MVSLKKLNHFVSVVRSRSSENEIHVDTFIMKKTNNPEGALREAITAYLKTPEGIEDIKATSEDFNWGDAMMYIPVDFWRKYDIQPLPVDEDISVVDMSEFGVDQDEVLIPDSYYVS